MATIQEQIRPRHSGRRCLQILGRNRRCHLPSEADTFGDASILRIVKTGVSDLKAFDPRLHLGGFSLRTQHHRLAERLASGRPWRRLDPQQEIGKLAVRGIQICIPTQFLIGPTELSVSNRHVIGYVDYYGSDQCPPLR